MPFLNLLRSEPLWDESGVFIPFELGDIATDSDYEKYNLAKQDMGGQYYSTDISTFKTLQPLIYNLAFYQEPEIKSEWVWMAIVGVICGSGGVVLGYWQWKKRKAAKKFIDTLGEQSKES